MVIFMPLDFQAPEGAGGSSAQPIPQTAKTQHPVLVAANQAAVISAAKSATSAANTAKSSASSTGAIANVAKTVSMPLIGLSKGAGSTVVGGSKSSSPSLVTAASLLGGGTVSGKTAATISGNQSFAVQGCHGDLFICMPLVTNWLLM